MRHPWGIEAKRWRSDGGKEYQQPEKRRAKRGNSMTSKQNRGGPVSPSHPPWLHRNTRAMCTLQTHSFPLSSATLHYPCSARHTEAQNHFLHTAAVRQLTAKLPVHPVGVTLSLYAPCTALYRCLTE